MAYHIILKRPTKLDEIAQAAKEGLNPRHSVVELATALNAKIHDGTGIEPSRADRLLGRITRIAPLWWAIARQLRTELKPGDVVYCTGEDIGVPVAVRCGKMPGVSVTMMAHYIDRPKGHLALQLFGLRGKVATFFTVAEPQAAFLRRFLRLPEERARFIWDQTDTRFFSPGPQSTDKVRPIIGSVGLEQRNYAVLAEATRDMDVDVRISGFSADTKVLERAFPAEMPHNMSRSFYSWPDLVQLYRDADIMVVSLFPNSYAAGIQALMEALSCGRPVVVTQTEGLAIYLDRPDIVRLVPVGDAQALRAAIAELLADRDARERRGEQAAILARQRHSLEGYVEAIAGPLRELAARSA